jgi:osmotically-inducible protein OsmY
MSARLFFITSFLLLALSGCAFIAGGAVVAGAAVVTRDHRTMNQAHHDQQLRIAIVKKLNQNTQINQDNTYVYVTVFYGQILLTGQVPNQSIKETATQLTESIPGVKATFNQLNLRGSSSELTRLSDAWLATKVKLHLLAVKDLKMKSININVNNGIVYLMGHKLSHRQATWAADAASKAAGVQKVVLCGV